MTKKAPFQYKTEQFDDIKILRYKINGLDRLSLTQKKLVYYLSQAAYFGRDIYMAQNYKHNLLIKRTLEAIFENYTDDCTSTNFKQLTVYLKKLWHANGIHHDYSNDKFTPNFTEEYFKKAVKNLPEEKLPLENHTVEELLNTICPVIFDKNIAAKNLTLDSEKDLLLCSENNHYEGVTQQEAENFYNNQKKQDGQEPVWHGLNSKLVKKNGQLIEQVYKIGGLYTEAIEQIVFWLKKALTVTENERQKQSLEKLIKHYQTGCLKEFNEYNKLWVKDTESVIDTINGFIEVYGDALGIKATWESVIQVKDFETTAKFEKISQNAGWFEKKSPILNEHKRKDAKGISFKVIQVAAESGACSPTTPIGINLPNADWLRAEYGSKSVSLQNIIDAYNKASKQSGFLDEFYLPEQIEIIKKYGDLGDQLHVGMHEVIGHGSGRIMPGVASPKDTLKSYANTIEEARADLVAYYYLLDPKLIELGLMPSIDVGKSEYISIIAGGMMLQLVRVKKGAVIEESHMRDRQLIAKWAYQKGKPENVIEQKILDGKTFFQINNYEKLRQLFGELLKEVQRIKSEGDYEAAKELVEKYGVQPDQKLHEEVLERYKKLNIAPFSGFINPVLLPIYENNEIVDVKIEYPDDFSKQMLYYSKKYSTLPAWL